MQALCYPARVLRRMESTMAELFRHISVGEKDGIIRIDFVKRNSLDQRNIDEIAQELSKSVESATNPRVELSFALVDRMSSAAFGELMKFQVRIKRRGGRLRLLNLNSTLLQGFRIIWPDDRFDLGDG